MKHVKWIFVVLLICSLTAFVEKDKPTGGLSEGDVAPDFKIRGYVTLTQTSGRFVFLNESGQGTNQ